MSHYLEYELLNMNLKMRNIKFYLQNMKKYELNNEKYKINLQLTVNMCIHTKPHIN